MGEGLALAQLAQGLPPWMDPLHQEHGLKLKKGPDKACHFPPSGRYRLRGGGGGMGGLAVGP